MNTKSRLLLLITIVFISGSLVAYWSIWTDRNLDINSPKDRVDEMAKTDETHDEFVNAEYIAQLKGMLSDERIRHLEQYIERMNKKNSMTALEQHKVEARLVPIEMTEQIIDRYNQEVPTPIEPVYSRMPEQEFYMTIVGYYADNANSLLDGGSGVNDAISKFLESGNINLVGLANIQDLYRKNQEATTKSVGIDATNNDVFEVLLTYYQEVGKVSENKDTLELKRMIEKAASDEVLSVADFNKIKKLYQSIIKKDALTALQGMINNKT